MATDHMTSIQIVSLIYRSALFIYLFIYLFIPGTSRFILQITDSKDREDQGKPIYSAASVHKERSHNCYKMKAQTHLLSVSQIRPGIAIKFSLLGYSCVHPNSA